MKRREFLLGFGAAGVAPLAPVKILAGTVGPAQNPALYLKAAQWSGLCDYSSAHMLKYQFGLDDRAAAGLFDRLVANQVVGLPDPGGMSRVIVSTYKNPYTVKKVEEALTPKHSVATSEPVKRVSLDDVDDRIDQLLADEKQAVAEVDEVAPDAIGNANMSGPL